MTGFLALLRKEALEQRRSRKFLAVLGVFLLVAIIPPVIAVIVSEVRGDVRDAAEASGGFSFFIGFVGNLGPLLAIMVMMGSLASERDSGTAAMTLHKPVTRTAFVLAKLTGFAVAFFVAMALGAVVFYLLMLVFFGDGGASGFAKATGVVFVYLMFLGAITFFWSALVRSATAAGGLALGTWIGMSILLVIPNSSRYHPLTVPSWAESLLSGSGGGSSDAWPAFLIAIGIGVVMCGGAWVVFQRKEL